MKTLLSLSLLSVFALGAGACGSDLSSELESWKKSACACKDKECAEKQAKAFWKLAEKFKDEKPSESEAKKLDKLADDGQECLESLDVDVYAMN